MGHRLPVTDEARPVAELSPEDAAQKGPPSQKIRAGAGQNTRGQNGGTNEERHECRANSHVERVKTEELHQPVSRVVVDSAHAPEGRLLRESG